MFKKIAIVLGIIALCFAFFQGNSEASGTDVTVKDGVFIHISHGYDDPHRVLMALKMAEIMSEDKDVLLYFDIRGIEVVLKDSMDITHAHFPGSKTQLKKLIGKGVQILVCPGCLKAAGKEAKDLIDGVKIANKDDFFTFTKGRILTFDY
jgi:predicted peroxiredoxin